MEDSKMGEEKFSLLRNTSTQHSKSVWCYISIISIAFLIGFIILAAVFVGLFVTAQNRANSLGAKQEQQCLSSQCVSLSAAVLASLNESVEPCQDFYKFACGGWESTNVIPEGHGRWSAFEALNQLNTIAISRLLGEPMTDTSDAVKKARSFYKSCMDTTAIEKRGKQPLVDLLTDLGGWELANISATSWNFSDLARDHLASGSALFGFSVSADAKFSSNQTIYLTQSGLTLPTRESYNDTKKLAYLQTLMQTAVRLLGGTNSSRVEEEMERVLDLEKELASIFYTNVQLRNLTLTYNQMTIEDLSANFTIHDQFDWLTYFRGVFEFAGMRNAITSETVVVVDTVDYFANLSSVLNAFPMDVIENYVKWTVAFPHLSLLSSEFRDLVHEFSANLTGTGATPRYEVCTSTTSNAVKYAVSRLYTRQNVINGTRSSMNTAIDNIQTAFKDRLDASTWLTSTTRDRCKQKVDQITRQIAYPEFVLNKEKLDQFYASLNITDENGYFENVRAKTTFNTMDNLKQFGNATDKTRWGLPPTAVNAYYNPSFNQFVFLEGILHPPFFNTEWPNYFLYGAIGVVIGHELTHGFDDQGQKYDGEGNYRQWWDKESQIRFNVLTKCYVEQYSNYSLEGSHVNGELTLGENIADNGGLHTSFQAYKSVAGGPNPDLPVFGGKYTHDQMFFIAFGQVWCSLYSSTYLETSTKTDPHSPGPIRVLGTLSNSQEFADAFSCGANTPYNPKEKCQLW